MTESALVSRAGYGKPGYCKLCAFAEAPALNERIQKGWTPRQINGWLQPFGLQADRGTIYRHKEHLKHPADKVVAHADKTRAAAKQNATTDEFLRAVQDIGFTRAQEHPEEVTIDHALKAAGILASKKERGTNVFLLMAQVVTGNAPTVLIEGEAEEIHPE